MKNFKEISDLIKIGQTIEYNIMDWMSYYDHSFIETINIKSFNSSGYLVLNILVLGKNLQEENHSLTVGIHENALIKYENYKYILNCLFSKFKSHPYKYFEKYGLDYNEN
jgi:hypothetical protein